MSTKLRADQAQKIATAEAAVADATRALEEAKTERDEVRERYAERLPLGEVISAGGFTIKRQRRSTGKRFSLKRYLEEHKLTKAMRPFVSEGSYEVWDVRPAPAPAARASANGHRRNGKAAAVAAINRRS